MWDKWTLAWWVVYWQTEGRYVSLCDSRTWDAVYLLLVFWGAVASCLLLLPVSWWSPGKRSVPLSSLAQNATWQRVFAFGKFIRSWHQTKTVSGIEDHYLMLPRDRKVMAGEEHKPNHIMTYNNKISGSCMVTPKTKILFLFRAQTQHLSFWLRNLLRYYVIVSTIFFTLSAL